MKRALINANIVMTDHIIRDGVIVIDDGRIAAFGKNLPTDGMETLDMERAYVGPGLIDIHTHAAGAEYFFFEEPEKAAASVLRHGVTDVMPALYFAMTADQLLEAAALIRGAMESGKADNIIGLYMEAPYLNPNFGGNRENNPWYGAVDEKKFAPLVDAVYDIARVWCLAPEREGIEKFCRYVKSKNPNAAFSVAHSEATPQQIERLMKYGLRNATHHTNATGTIQNYPECRGVCVDETVLYNDGIYAELICDKVGIHVDPYMLRMVRKIKGDDRVILISDAYIDHGPVPSEGYEGVDDINFDFSGEIAGTRLFLDMSCRNMMTHTGASLCQVFKFASVNPARMLGLTDRGAIAEGNVANLIAVDPEFNVKHVFLKGKTIK